MADKILGGLLWAGVAYFCCMAAAHFVGFKMPLLFIYYDAPFYAYQDKIIAFAVVAYICLFYSAARIPDVVPAALAALLPRQSVRRAAHRSCRQGHDRLLAADVATRRLHTNTNPLLATGEIAACDLSP
ncbi:hypothetical protein V1294_006925 [Bradyrhizobium sp. AZCC 1678]|uniref:hypothetical protein n=1 Tax=Bradyrhizobium sp. AZCC 1678 TaxID=3117030 RepID=UPI002FEFAE0C